jgi:hypothetical protein
VADSAASFTGLYLRPLLGSDAKRRSA